MSTLTLEGLLQSLAPEIEKSAEQAPVVAAPVEVTPVTPVTELSGLQKSASEQGAEFARTIMEKTASMTQVTPQTAGASLAQHLLGLLKQASVGDTNTANGVSPTTETPTKITADNASMDAEHAATVQPMPTSDGLRPTGSMNEIYDAVIAQALAQGATSDDQVAKTSVAPDEGAVVDGAVPNQVKTAAVNDLMEQGVDFEDAVYMTKVAFDKIEDDMEKAAAVDALVAEGVDFDSAFKMVKQAAEELEFEEVALTKAACLQELVAEGVSFDEAVELIKQASVGDVNSSDGLVDNPTPTKITLDNASMDAEHAATVKPMLTSDGLRPTGTMNQIYDAVIADALAQGATSDDQVGKMPVAPAEGAEVDGAVPNQVKTASLKDLVSQGVDFDRAVAIVKQASEMAKQANALTVVSDAVIKGPAKAAMGGSKMKSIGGMADTTAKELAKKHGVAAGAGVAGLGAGYAAGSQKQAALNDLINQGVDFDAAVEMIKEAGAVTKPVYEALSKAERFKKFGKEVAGKAMAGAKKAGDKAMAHPKSMAAGAGAAGAAAGYAVGREKKAAFDALVAQGVDFDVAAELVSAKALELYGQ